MKNLIGEIKKMGAQVDGLVKERDDLDNEVVELRKDKEELGKIKNVLGIKKASIGNGNKLSIKEKRYVACFIISMLIAVTGGVIVIIYNNNLGLIWGFVLFVVGVLLAYFTSNTTKSVDRYTRKTFSIFLIAIGTLSLGFATKDVVSMSYEGENLLYVKGFLYSISMFTVSYGITLKKK